MIKILGISSSARRAGTEKAVLTALEGAQSIDGIETHYVSFKGKTIHPCIHCDQCLTEGVCIYDDDTEGLLDLLFEYDGFIIGSPVYNSNINAQLAAFFNRLRMKDKVRYQDIRPLAYKVAGAIAVGGARNCGQEMAVLNILNTCLAEGMIPVGGDKWEGSGACVWSGKSNVWNEDYDPIGLKAAYNIGLRVATVTKMIKLGHKDRG
jgi:multimeric flavodoxin WrbA